MEKETEEEADQTGQCKHAAHRAALSCKRNGNSKYNNNCSSSRSSEGYD